MDHSSPNISAACLHSDAILISRSLLVHVSPSLVCSYFVSAQKYKKIQNICQNNIFNIKGYNFLECFGYCILIKYNLLWSDPILVLQTSPQYFKMQLLLLSRYFSILTKWSSSQSSEAIWKKDLAWELIPIKCFQIVSTSYEPEVDLFLLL